MVMSQSSRQAPPIAWWRNSGLVLLLLLFLPPVGGVLAIFSRWHLALKLLAILWALAWSAALLLLWPFIQPLLTTAISG